MAQIRKYQSGGNTPKEIGVLTIDGKDYTGDGFIQHMREYGKTLDDKTRDQFGNIINALEAGENLSYDSDSDVLTGNVNWAGIRKSREDNLEHDRTKIGKFFGALNNGMEQNARYAINALQNMPGYEEPKPKSKNIDWSKAITLSYTKNDDGTISVSPLENAAVINRLNELSTLLDSNWSENDTFIGYNTSTRKNYQDAYANVDIKQLVNKIQGGTWNQEDLKTLQDFGILDKPATPTPALTPTPADTPPPTDPVATHSASSSTVPTASTAVESIPTSLTGWAKSRINFNDQKGVPYDWASYYTKDGEDDIYFTWDADDELRELSEYNAIPISKTLFDKIKDNTPFWNKMRDDLAFRQRVFYKLMSPYWSAFKNKLYNEIDDEELKEYGFSFNDDPRFDKNAWNTGHVDNRAELKHLKHGGIIKYDAGGTTKSANYKPAYATNQQPPVFSTKGDEILNIDLLDPANALETVGIAADIAATVSGFVPGYGGVASALIGWAGNKAYLASDLLRSGGQPLEVLKSFGRQHVNDALSLASVLPVAGDALQIGKTSSKIANILKRGGGAAMKVLPAAFLAMGLPDAKDSLDKIVTGKGTLEDYRNVAIAAQAFVGTARVIGNRLVLNKNLKPITTNSVKAPIAINSADEYIKGLKQPTAFKKKVVETVLKNKPFLTKLNGNYTSWAPNGTVENFDDAFDALRNSGHITDADIDVVKPWYQRVIQPVSDLGNTVKGKVTDAVNTGKSTVRKGAWLNPFNQSLRGYQFTGDYQNSNVFQDYLRFGAVPTSTIAPKDRPLIFKNQNGGTISAGEAPPKWKQNLKDYVARAFNYENLNTLGQIVGAVAANHKVAKVKENALKSMPLSRNVFQASTPAYYENTRGFDLRRQQLLNTQLPQTADAKLNAQWKRNLMGELDNINREKYSYLSSNRNQYNQQLNAVDNKNRELRVAESNAFMDRISQRNMALAENQAGTIANDYKTFEQTLKKDLYNWQQDRAIYDKFDAAEKQAEFLKKYETAATEWAKTHAATGNEVGQSDLQRFFAANPAEYDKYQTEVLAAKRASYRPKSMWSFKKGGKLSAEDHIKINRAKSQDRINENKYKSIDKAVQKINDNVMKIFLNIMK